MKIRNNIELNSQQKQIFDENGFLVEEWQLENYQQFLQKQIKKDTIIYSTWKDIKVSSNFFYI